METRERMNWEAASRKLTRAELLKSEQVTSRDKPIWGSHDYPKILDSGCMVRGAGPVAGLGND